ncbi:unnamed protein product, partial [Gulo gulo]
LGDVENWKEHGSCHRNNNQNSWANYKLTACLAPLREHRPQGYPGIWEKQASVKEAQDSSICSFTDLGQMPALRSMWAEPCSPDREQNWRGQALPSLVYLSGTKTALSC